MADQATGLLSPWLRKKRITMTCPYIQGRVLDYGCGVGVLAEICKCDTYLGFDIDEESLEIARKSYPGFHFTSKISEREHFDTIVSLAVIEHVPDPAALLAKFKRILRPEGRIVVTTPHPSFEWMHTLSSKIGLCSAHASEEHKQLINYRLLKELATEADLIIEKYERFLFGANLLFVLRC